MKLNLKCYTALLLLFAWQPAFCQQNDPDEHYYHRTIHPQSNTPVSPETSGNSGTGANMNVVYHRISWTIDPNDATKTITGTITTYFVTIAANVSAISFDLNKTSFNNGSLVVTHHGNTCTKSFPSSGNVNILNITLSSTIVTSGTLDSVTVSYSGVPPMPVGLAEGYQRGSDAGAGNYVMTLSESYEDRDWWPCKADMQDKIDSMDITVNVPWGTPTAADTFWVASNGKLIDSTISGSSRSFTFKNRYPMASYLVSVCVAKFNRYYRSVNIGGTAVPVVYNLFRGKGSYTTILSKMDSMNLALAAFSNKFGHYPFKLEKHGFYEGLLGAAGMEHQTFSAIATGSVTSARTLVHELMHQWFGDNVTFSTWNDLWLAEGFARYSEALYYELVANNYSMAYSVRNSLKSTALALNAQSTWIPNSSTGTSDLIWSTNYGNTVYERGSVIVSMLRILCGDTKFYQALTNYQTNRATSSATTDTLKNYFNYVLGTDISGFFDDYVGGSGTGSQTGGVGNPVYTIQWNTPTTTRFVMKVVSQTQSGGSNVTYFNGPVTLHLTNAPSSWTKDTTIVFYDWGSGNLSYAGNGLSSPVGGNILNYDLSFTPTNVFYDDSARTLSTGTATKNTSLLGYTWLGTTSSAWATSSNWSAAAGLPPANAQVTIATTGSQPVLSADVTLNTLTLNSGTSLSLNGRTLTLNDDISGTGTITGSSASALTMNGTNGTVNFTQTSAATRSLNNFTLNSGNITLGNALDIYGTVSLSSSSFNLNTQNLTLKSTASATARIANLTGNTFSGASNVTIERYIPANSTRAWRMLSVPTSGQTIKESWQENQAAGSTSLTGQGVQITSNSGSWSANGFDFLTGGNSLLRYDSSSNTWTGVTATTSAIANTTGYMLFIRGDRTATPANSLITATTLRTTGTIYQGTQTAIPVSNNKFSLAGNILPSAIDFRNVTRSANVDAAYYVWDPKLTGSYGLGAYQTFTLSGGNYLISPGGGSYGANGSINNTIESGQAFLVHATGGNGTIQLNESCKTTGGGLPFTASGLNEQLATNLYAVTGTGNRLADGTLVLYDVASDNAVTAGDAKKINNFGDNLYMLRNDSSLAIEKRSLIGFTDTVYYRIGGLKQQAYQFELVTANLDHANLLCKFVDNYTGTNTPVNLNGNTTYDFAVNSDPASSATDRFSLVYYTSGPLPVYFSSVKGYNQGSNNVVEWKVENELNINRYVIEKSTDGRNFSTGGTQPATGNNNGSVMYKWIDMNVINSINYYRIKSIGNAGDIKYSSIVKVAQSGKAKGISVYPNPVTNQSITLYFTAMQAGMYDVRLISSTGIVIASNKLACTGGNTVFTLKQDNILADGVYQLEAMGADGKKWLCRMLIKGQ